MGTLLDKEMNVLILVLMEKGGSFDTLFSSRKLADMVLILVLMGKIGSNAL